MRDLKGGAIGIAFSCACAFATDAQAFEDAYFFLCGTGELENYEVFSFWPPKAHAEQGAAYSRVPGGPLTVQRADDTFTVVDGATVYQITDGSLVMLSRGKMEEGACFDIKPVATSLHTSILQQVPEVERLREEKIELNGRVRQLEGQLAQVETSPLPSRVVADLARQMQQCWVVDVGSDAAATSVTLRVELEPDGRVDPASIRLVSAEGPSDAGKSAAFEAARRAVLRCQSHGYDVPERAARSSFKVTFDPDQMRVR